MYQSLTPFQWKKYSTDLVGFYDLHDDIGKVFCANIDKAKRTLSVLDAQATCGDLKREMFHQNFHHRYLDSCDFVRRVTKGDAFASTKNS